MPLTGAAGLLLAHGLDLGGAYLLKVLALLALILLGVVRGLARHQPFARFGAANQMTLGRAALVALLGGLVGEAPSGALAVAATLLASVAALLDSLDGWLARRTRMASDFGARFDMETDALLILVLALLAWQFGKAGIWVLASGLLRYLFVAAGLALRWMRADLPPSRRRKVVAVIQVVALIITVAPLTPPGVSAAVAATGLAALVLSFSLDVRWLYRRATAEEQRQARDGLALVVALIILNGSVTFHNIWPTLGVHWPGELSIEFSVLLLALTISNARLGQTRPGVLAVLSIVVVTFALGRYAYVTVQALYGRDINLYWDGPQLGAVIAMFMRVAALWTIAAVGLGTLAVLALLYRIARWSLGRVDRALHTYAAARYACGTVALLLVGSFLLQRSSDAFPRVPRFSIPVSRTFAAQAGRIADALSGKPNRDVPPSPVLRSSFAALGGNDVLLVFMESYGSTTYDRPDFAQALQPARARLAAALQDTRRAAVSAYVSSPTFGGGSVLAHLSLLSGIEVRDSDHYALLMTQKRPTLVSQFRSAGYRAVAVMPGLRESWPEGAFYGFDRIYGAEELNYHGPEFGWWRIPDQFSLAALDSWELQRHPRKPLFVFFPTVSTHMPFEPTPPLQSDWNRMLSAHPFDAEPLRHALTQTPVWTDMGRAYVSSVQYFLDTLSSYLRARPDDQFVMIILGDHQPAANVSGEGASWDVPVHVIASRPRILQALQAVGFRPGLTPVRRAAGKMSALGPWLLAAFGKP